MIDRLRLRALAHCGLLSALLLVAPVAGAAPPSADDATSQRIAELYQRANVLYGKKSLTEAEALYREAWKLKKTYDVACNFGAIELDLGRPREAAEYLTFALREFPAGEKPAAREQIKARLTLARSQIGVVRVRVNVTGAAVSVEDRLIGNAPIEDEVFVNPGTRTIRATLDGYVAAQATVQLAAGSSQDVALELKVKKRDAVPAIVMGSVGGVALVTGAVLLGLGEAKRSDVNALVAQTDHSCVVNAPAPQGACAQLASAATKADTLGNGGIVALVVAGAAAVGVTTYMLWPTSQRDAGSGRGLQVVPLASANGGGVLLFGSF
jgi:hypothetical protein